MKLKIDSRSLDLKLFSIVVILGAVAMVVRAADVAGTWTGQFFIGNMNTEPRPFGLILNTDGVKLTGRFCGNGCSDSSQGGEIQNGKVDGDTISFTLETGESAVPQLDFQGTDSGATIQFTINGKPPECGGSECEIGHATATRKTS